MSLDTIELWHKRARPSPTDKDFNVQLGCHLEEVVEMLECLTSDDAVASDDISTVRIQVAGLAENLKRGAYTLGITNRKEFLDSLADQIVTATGVGHCAGMNTSEACVRVSYSNWSKFDENGQPLRDANGKIAKGPRYAPPDLEGLY